MDDYYYHQSGRRPQYKSRVERQIGDLLTARRIPFVYEKPTAVMDRGAVRLWYPDFSLQYGLLIEYFGVNGERDYLERTRHRITCVSDVTSFMSIVTLRKRRRRCVARASQPA